MLEEAAFHVELASVKGWFNDVNARHAAQSEAPPPMEGWLWKRGRINTNWKNRFCVLRDGALAYFKERGDRKPAGCVRVADSVVLSSEAGASAASSHRVRWCFSVWTAERTFYFGGPDKEAVVEWMKTLLLHAVPPPRDAAPPHRAPAAAARARSGSLLRKLANPSDVDERDLFDLTEAHIELSSLQSCREMMNGKQEDLSFPFSPYQYASQ